MTAAPRRWRHRGERGVVGGGEALAFGCLVLLAGSLLFTHVWAVVETRVALDAAAREYLRVYTGAADAPHARIEADLAARSTLSQRGTPLTRLRITAPDPATFGPCGTATVALQARVPAARAPFLGTFSSTEVHLSHTELIGAHREVEPHGDFDPDATACA